MYQNIPPEEAQAPTAITHLGSAICHILDKIGAIFLK
jgi:hypothetical protein